MVPSGLPPDPFAEPASDSPISGFSVTPAAFHNVLEYQISTVHVFERVLSAYGFKGVATFCQACGVDHCLTWHAMVDGMECLRAGAPPPPHEPAHHTDPENYRSWLYCVGFLDGLTNTTAQHAAQADIDQQFLTPMEFEPEIGDDLLVDIPDDAEPQIDRLDQNDGDGCFVAPDPDAVISIRDMLQPHGIRGLVVLCDRCHEPHCYTWGAIQRHHASSHSDGPVSVTNPNPRLYADWEYATGFIAATQTHHKPT